MKCKDCMYAVSLAFTSGAFNYACCTLTRRIVNPETEVRCNCFNRDLSEYNICYNCKYYIGGGDWGLFCEKHYHHLGKFNDDPCKDYEKKVNKCP